jgi:hypothetical protein
MAIFKKSDNEFRFSCFYYQHPGANYYSGTYYVLSAVGIDRLYWTYRLTSLFAAVLLVVLCLAFFSQIYGYSIPSLWFSFAILADAVLVLPLALLVLWTKKIKVEKEPLILDRKRSVSVYISIALMLFNLSLAILLSGLQSPLLVILSIISAIGMVATIWRLKSLTQAAF